ncbi:hypothetical protein [Rhodococcus pyridinivorans]|uniref:hypothetical protein n=1 Tax=Rhodococcus pyridinivorans TaxID=103816 RepID=UPI003AB074C5
MNAADLADIWWNEQSPERRIAIHGWLCRNRQTEPAPIEGQLEMPFPEPEGQQ